MRNTVKTAAKDEIAQVLADLRQGGQGGQGGQDDGLARLLPLVYDELRAIADGYLHRERVDHTLQATALVHEAYMRLADCDPVWTDRKHFYRVAAKIMRRILINHALEHRAVKRGGGGKALSLTEVTVALPGRTLIWSPWTVPSRVWRGLTRTKRTLSSSAFLADAPAT